jgi:thioredoxin-related protein
MRNIFIIMWLLLPMIVEAQNNGVEFVKSASWKEVLTNANANNKYIFVDLYATWCGPCKMMDANVYTNSQVSTFLNTNFISVKVQVDQTKNDPDQIKKWYSDAQYFIRTYHIDALPAFLFFSPDGQMVQKNDGYRNSVDFLNLLQVAKNPKQNYAGLINQYQNGQIKGVDLLQIALDAKSNRDDSLANKIAMEYKRDWLDKHDPKQIASKQLLDFFSAFYPLMCVNDKLIKYFYHNPTEVDSLLGGKGYSTTITDYVISKDLINSVIKSNGAYIEKIVDWDVIEQKVSNLYDKITASRLIINAKIAWYNDKKDWGNVAKYNIEKIDKQGIDTVGIGRSNVNNMVFYIMVQHIDDPVVLNKGLEYMELILRNNRHRDTWIDTYASLLYKIGRKSEAIKQELLALNIAEKRNDQDSKKEYSLTLQKMQDDLPLW